MIGGAVGVAGVATPQVTLLILTLNFFFFEKKKVKTPLPPLPPLPPDENPYHFIRKLVVETKSYLHPQRLGSTPPAKKLLLHINIYCMWVFIKSD